MSAVFSDMQPCFNKIVQEHFSSRQGYLTCEIWLLSSRNVIGRSYTRGYHYRVETVPSRNYKDSQGMCSEEKRSRFYLAGK